MQKKLEAELISIAHRILKLKNKSELDQLYLETGKLYEKLAVLKFLETHFSDARPTIGHAEVSDKLALILDEPEAEDTAVEAPQDGQEKADEQTEDTVETSEAEAPETIETAESEAPEPNNEVEKEEVTEEAIESVEEEAEAADEEHEIQETAESEKVAEELTAENDEAFKPSFELSFEKKEDDKKAPKQISFEDLLGGHDYNDDIFEKVGAKKEEEKAEKEPEPTQEEIKEEEKPEIIQEQNTAIDKSEYEKPAVAHNGKTITFGLNDRIGFEKHLFGGSSEDMNRVVSQLNTFDTFQEAQDFIEDMVKPDYNNWENKDDYAQRFLDIVEKKFS